MDKEKEITDLIHLYRIYKSCAETRDHIGMLSYKRMAEDTLNKVRTLIAEL